MTRKKSLLSPLFDIFAAGSALIFGLPLLLFAGALLWAIIGPDRSTGTTRKATSGECDIPGIARGTVMKEVNKVDGQVVRETRTCSLSYLPGHWQPRPRPEGGYPSWEIDPEKKCITRDGDMGRIWQIRKPGEIGLHVPDIDVCAVSKAL